MIVIWGEPKQCIRGYFYNIIYSQKLEVKTESFQTTVFTYILHLMWKTDNKKFSLLVIQCKQ